MGSSLNGRLGHRTTHGYVSFGSDEKMVYVACGADFTVGISENRERLYAWGLGIYGNLGDGLKRDRDIPVPFYVMDPELNRNKRVLVVSCGARHCLALCEDSQVFAYVFFPRKFPFFFFFLFCRERKKEIERDGRRRDGCRMHVTCWTAVVYTSMLTSMCTHCRRVHVHADVCTSMLTCAPPCVRTADVYTFMLTCARQC